MSSRRTLILIGALVIGAIAAFVLFNYVSGLRDSVYEDTKLVQIFKVSGQVDRGTLGSEAQASQLIQPADIPMEFRPETAVVNFDEIKNKVAAFDLAPGTVVVKDMFVDRDQAQVSFRNRLKKPDHVAMSFSVGNVQAVGGFLVGGDDVNMMVPDEMEWTEEARAQACPIDEEAILQGGGPSCLDRVMRMLYQEVHILAVGNNVALEPGEETPEAAEDSGGSSANQGLITVNVPVEASLFLATFAGSEIYLALTPETYTPEAVPPLPVVIEQFPGENQDQLTPYGTQGDSE